MFARLNFSRFLIICCSRDLSDRGRPRTSWLKYLDNIVKERGTHLKEVEAGGIHLNKIV